MYIHIGSSFVQQRPRARPSAPHWRSICGQKISSLVDGHSSKSCTDKCKITTVINAVINAIKAGNGAFA